MNCPISKKGRSNNTFTLERDADLLAAYRLALNDAGCPFSLIEVCHHVATMPARRFWVSSERAYQVVTAIRQGKSLERMHPLRRDMFLEIERRCQELEEADGSSSLMKTIEAVVSQPAPSFYLTPQSVKIIIHRIKKKKKECLEYRKKLLRYCCM